jgi:hypothetical protein
MKKVGNFICKNKILILIITMFLLIPTVIGYIKTDINYDILVYLPSDIETLKGEEILTDDFNMGAFSIVVVDNASAKEILALEDKFRSIKGVGNVVSINDITGTTIPLEMLPSELTSKVSYNNSELILVTFTNSTSDDETLNAVQEMRDISNSNIKIGGMSAMVLDTKELFNSEMLLYVTIAVILCIIVLELALDSYLVPFLLMANIGVAILFNMGSNIIFGEISYITKAIAAVLQLGVTTDFSIFLYHKYENAKKKYNDKFEAMTSAIVETFTSVFGSSLTTIAGFLALCTMNLTLGVDIGLVMAKGVLIGVICVLTLFPSLLLVFDKYIEKTKHKQLLPKFRKVQNFIMNHYVLIFIIFLILLIPSYLAQNKTEVYYKLDESIPDDYGYSIATKTLKEDYGMVSQEIVLVKKDMDDYSINKMVQEIKNVDGIGEVINPSNLSSYGISSNMIPENILNLYQTDDYKMIIITSDYDIATNELNDQITQVNEIIKKYNSDNILAGEGPLMKDLVTTTDEDFHNVNYTSIAVIFVLMMIVLKSISLPILLVITIEEAIFINMGIPYFTATQIPFIASVVIGTIQLGATIDYAILLTTKYIEERKKNNKKDSVKIALESSITSIFVSGMCFFAATIGVGIVSKIDMIGSLCTLIARGAIISMLIVIFVIPSILLIFDKLICKTTLGFGRRNMKNNIKKVSLSVLAISVLMNAVPVYALTKDETVYAKLENNGEVKNILVNEHLINNESQEEISDLTNLLDILNINGDEEYKLDGNNITWNANSNDIYYQGTIEKQLPVSLDITYYLDGVALPLDEIIGKSGKVKINLKYTNNDKHIVKVDGIKEELYTPFVVTTATIIDSTNNSNIEVTNGKVVNNGTNNIVVGLTSPGLYESLGLYELKGMDEVNISFDTTNFELSSIYSIMSPKLIETSDLNIFDKLDSLTSSSNELSTKMDEIESASELLSDGSLKLSDGTALIYDSLSTLTSKLTDLETGITNVDDGLNQVITSLDDTLKLTSSNEEKIKQLKSLIENNNTAINNLNNVNSSLKNNYETYNLSSFTVEQIMSFTASTYSNFGLTLTEDEASNMNNQLVTLKSTYESNMNLINLLSGNNTALTQTLDTLQSTDTVTMITTLQSYLKEIEQGTSQLKSGATQITQGANLLTEKTKELSDGTTNLYNGITKLQQGVSNYNTLGIKKLTDYSNKLNNMKQKTLELIKLGEDYSTFTMKESGVEGQTKFVLVIDSYKSENKQEEVKVEQQKDTFWTRVKNLFK